MREDWGWFTPARETKIFRSTVRTGRASDSLQWISPATLPALSRRNWTQRHLSNDLAVTDRRCYRRPSTSLARLNRAQSRLRDRVSAAARRARRCALARTIGRDRRTTPEVQPASGSNLTFESRVGFPRRARRASLHDARWKIALRFVGHYSSSARSPGSRPQRAAETRLAGGDRAVDRRWCRHE